MPIKKILQFYFCDNWPIFLRVQLAIFYIILVYLLFFLGSKPGAGSLVQPPFDKLLHLIYYGGLTYFGWQIIAKSNAITPSITSFTIGLVNEITQYFQPYRTFELLDIGANLVGISLIILLILATQKSICMKNKKQPCL